MLNKLDPRHDVRSRAALRKLPHCAHVPLVHPRDLEEVAKIYAALPPLHFPIESGGQLIDNLGRGEHLDIVGVQVDPLRMIKFMPAYYFPIVSVENFIEKMAELIRANRKQVDVPQQLQEVQKQLPDLEFPIHDRNALLRAILRREEPYRFRDAEVDPVMAIGNIPNSFFPIESRSDFEQKIVELMTTIPLVVSD